VCGNTCCGPTLPSDNASYPQGRKGIEGHSERVRAAVWQESWHELLQDLCDLGRLQEQPACRSCPRCPPRCNLVVLVLILAMAAPCLTWKRQGFATRLAKEQAAWHAQATASSSTDNILHFATRRRVG